MSTRGKRISPKKNFLYEPNLDKIFVTEQVEFGKWSNSSHQTPFFLLDSIIPATDRSRGPGLPGKVGTAFRRAGNREILNDEATNLDCFIL
jgi:hypothetical protein